jgi:hypothetical protein
VNHRRHRRRLHPHYRLRGQCLPHHRHTHLEQGYLKQFKSAIAQKARTKKIIIEKLESFTYCPCSSQVQQWRQELRPCNEHYCDCCVPVVPKVLGSGFGLVAWKATWTPWQSGPEMVEARPLQVERPVAVHLQPASVAFVVAAVANDVAVERHRRLPVVARTELPRPSSSHHCRHRWSRRCNRIH